MRATSVAACVTVAAALLTPSASHAATPCWQRVLDDWRDGHLDGDHAVRCYREALAHLPEDLRVYGTAETDIQRELTRALAERPGATRVRARPAEPRTARTKPKAVAARSPVRRRTLASHRPSKTKARVATPRTAAKPQAWVPVETLVALGSSAVVAAAALAASRRAAAIRRRGDQRV